MISHLHNTTVSAINKELSHLTAANGSLSSGRVLTLVVLAEKGHSREAMRAAIRASHEHPSRIIVHISHDPLDPDQLDAEIHLGGDTGASEMIVLRGWGSASRPTEALISGLLLPDSPIVVWWPHSVPENPAQHSIGRIAQRRITDSARADDPKEALRKLTDVFRAGDTDPGVDPPHPVAHPAGSAHGADAFLPRTPRGCVGFEQVPVRGAARYVARLEA